MSVKLLPCISDSYITDKIISNKFKATDANVGFAGTLNLFALHAENSFLSGSTRITGSNENSRILIKFDLDPLKQLTGSILDISNMSCSLMMQNVVGGQTLPTSPYTVEAYLLSRSWTENVGRDIIQYGDIGEANWHTASVKSDGSTDLWAIPGAGASGFVGTTLNIDYFTGSNITGNLTGSQTFTEGSENMDMDITSLVSASLAYPDLIPDAGFIVKFPTGSESGTSSLWVKRFASRHGPNFRIRPKILVRFPSEVQDHHRSFFFSVSGSLFLNNTIRGQSANIISGSTQTTGLNSILLKLESGSYKEFFTGSQHQVGNNFITGTYSASFGIDQFHPTLRTEILSAGSCSFDEVWEHLDNTLIHSASEKFVINSLTPSTFNKTPSNMQISITNMRQQYSVDEVPRFRIEAFETDPDELKVSKIPVKRKSLIFTKCYYRVRDAYNDDIIVPFDADGTDEINATLCSTDSEGMYFDAHWVQDLSIGRVYVIDLMIKDLGVTQIFDRLDTKFKIV